VSTFLVTSKMDPALAARIEAAVTGERRVRSAAKSGPGARSRRLVALARFSFVALLGVAIVMTFVFRRRQADDTARARAALLARVRAEGAPLEEEHRRVVPSAQALVAREAGGYDADLVSDPLRAPDGIKAALARPTVYLRGPLPSIAELPIAESTAGSHVDALVACLVDPPPARTEKAMLDRVRASYGTAGAGKAPQVRRLHDAVVGLPLLERPFERRVETAADLPALDRLRAELDRGNVARAREAARAELILLALDEPGDPRTPAELDGERPHDVRVVLVERATGQTLLRVRRHVDPSFVSSSRRASLARGFDSCALALDVLAAAH
jgi:hypothetical protein